MYAGVPSATPTDVIVPVVAAESLIAFATPRSVTTA